MTATEFAYWLRGFTELAPSAQPTPDQWLSIQQHLELVFTKVTPPLGQPAFVQPSLQEMIRSANLTMTC